MNIEEILKSIGLNDKEIKVYLAILELGQSTVLPISNKSGIKRTYCYDILDELKKKNLVSYIEKNNRRRYFAEDPKKIDDHLKNQQKSFEHVLPELRSIFNKAGNKPKVRYFEGSEEMLALYKEIMDKEECLAISSPLHLYKRLGEPFRAFNEKLLHSKVKIRELITQDGIEAEYVKNYKKPLREARLLPIDLKISTDMILYDDKLVLFSYEKEIHAIMIESSSIVKTQKVLFEIIWNIAEKILS